MVEISASLAELCLKVTSTRFFCTMAFLKSCTAVFKCPKLCLAFLEPSFSLLEIHSQVCFAVQFEIQLALHGGELLSRLQLRASQLPHLPVQHLGALGELFADGPQLLPQLRISRRRCGWLISAKRRHGSLALLQLPLCLVALISDSLDCVYQSFHLLSLLRKVFPPLFGLLLLLLAQSLRLPLRGGPALLCKLRNGPSQRLVLLSKLLHRSKEAAL
mmetsp:Transcript_38867/g.108117  ORF Transcript_38867/g.108117 Transcript_38867/m.108117 type:complete len:217 (-) Transcript_38867:736-1386(-)